IRLLCQLKIGWIFNGIHNLSFRLADHLTDLLSVNFGSCIKFFIQAMPTKVQQKIYFKV
ncbi:hypothetical protein ALC53_03208, partial [Atta colombica]